MRAARYRIRARPRSALARRDPLTLVGIGSQSQSSPLRLEDGPHGLPTQLPTRRLSPVCANCGQRPGSVRVVLAAEGGRRAGALCEVCAREFFAVAAAGAPPEAAAPSRSPRPPRSTSSAATSPPTRPTAASTP